MARAFPPTQKGCHTLFRIKAAGRGKVFHDGYMEGKSAFVLSILAQHASSEQQP